MIRIGDKISVQPTFAGEWKDQKKAVGKIIALYPRFALVQFPCGFRECYVRCGGPDSLEAL